jgi:hypothetical protein
MDDHRPDDPTPSPEQGKPKREPPTIDLEASEVTSSTSDADGGGTAGQSSFRLPSVAIPPFAVAAITGAAAAVFVVAVAWALGWPPDTTRSVAEINVGAIEALSSRMVELEGRLAKPAPADPALSSRLDALDKSLASLKTDLAGARARSEKLASEIDAVKSAPASSTGAPASVDLSGIEARMAEVEQTVRVEKENLAQAAGKPADDIALRRLVVASVLEISARQGEPFTEALKSAKALAGDPQVLKPLETFASTGLPNAANLCRELLTLVPKLEPPAPDNTTSSSGLVGRLQAGAAKLVRIERTDATGHDRAAIVARVTAAAVRNDLNDTRRELNSLSPADREPAQAWLDKVAARDAALSASRHFATDAMAALAKPAP